MYETVYCVLLVFLVFQAFAIGYIVGEGQRKPRKEGVDVNTNIIEYESDNGYTGRLYGESSFSIYGPDGKEVFHTGSRSFDSYKDLKDHVETYPELRKKMEEAFMDIYEDDTEEEDDI